MLSNKNLGDALSELIAEQDITLEKIAELTNIPKRFLRAMLESDFKNMPASPYVKGYINKICTVLNADPLPIIEIYNKNYFKSTNKEDYLPKNRFIIERQNIQWIIAPIIIIIIIITTILFTNNHLLANFMGIPIIEINLPAEEIIETQNQFFIIDGNINPRDSIIINGELVPTTKEGMFSKEVILSPGLNTFEITAKRFLGRQTTITRKVFYIVEELNENINGIINHGEETN